MSRRRLLGTGAAAASLAGYLLPYRLNTRITPPRRSRR